MDIETGNPETSLGSKTQEWMGTKKKVSNLFRNNEVT